MGDDPEVRARSNQAVQVAADFLLRFDIALRRQEAFRAHFDSRALDVSAIYLHHLIEQAASQWAAERKDRVTDSLAMLLEAATLYEGAGGLLRYSIGAPDGGRARMLVDAKGSARKAALRLARMSYSHTRRVMASFKDLMEDAYIELEDTAWTTGMYSDANMASLTDGLEAFQTVLQDAPPV